MSDQIVADVPDTWEQLTLGELCSRGGGDVQTGPFGSLLHASDYVAVGVPSVMPQNIGDNVIVEDGIAQITQEDAERLAKYRLREGDIVYSRRGDVERRALVRLRQDGWLCGTGCLRVRAGTAVDPRYLTYYLGHPDARSWIVRHAIGATMPNLNTKTLCALPVVLPPNTEQAAIAGLLGALDDKIAVNDRIAKTSSCLSSQLFARDVWNYESDVDLPEGYKPGSIGDLCDRIGNGGTPKRAVAEYWRNGTIPWFKTGELHDGPLVASEECISHAGLTGSSCAIWPKGSVLVALYASPTVGRLGVLQVDATFNQACSALVACKEVGQYVLFETIKATRSRLQSIAVGAAQQNISQAVLSAHRVVVPSRNSALRFHRTADALFQRQVASICENARLAELRDTLLPRLISGELRIKDAERVVSDAV